MQKTPQAQTPTVSKVTYNTRLHFYRRESENHKWEADGTVCEINTREEMIDEIIALQLPGQLRSFKSSCTFYLSGRIDILMEKEKIRVVGCWTPEIHRITRIDFTKMQPA